MISLKKLVEKEESETLEFKKSLSEWKEIVETVSAFSNTKGGIIVVGVDDNKNLVGVNIGKGTVEDLTNKVLTNTEPKIYPEIEVAGGEKEKIVIIKVETYPYDVVLAFGRPFKRVGKNTVRMSKENIKEGFSKFIKKRSTSMDSH